MSLIGIANQQRNLNTRVIDPAFHAWQPIPVVTEKEDDCVLSSKLSSREVVSTDLQLADLKQQYCHNGEQGLDVAEVGPGNRGAA